jgi:hypothetical protein
MSATFDYVVIGSGLSGLAIATRLSQETSKVLLLDSEEVAGGWLMKPHLAAAPVTLSSESSFLFLESLTGIKIIGAPQERAPVTFDEGQFKNFIGFGEKTPDFYDEMAPYCSSHFYELKASPSVWIQRLLSKFKGTFAPRSIATRFVVEDGKVQHLLVNGTKKLFSQNFIYCGDVKPLARLLPLEILNSKTQSKISKTKTWTRAVLQLEHDHVVTENSAFHILIGTSQDEIVTCVGEFSGTMSTWTTFVPDEDAEEAENVGQALKRIKRQIKRAYPNSISETTRERICVQSGFGGHFEVKLNGDQSWPEVPNLWIGSSTVQKNRNLVGALSQAQLVLASLGFGTPTLEEVSGSSTDEGDRPDEVYRTVTNAV